MTKPLSPRSSEAGALPHDDPTDPNDGKRMLSIMYPVPAGAGLCIEGDAIACAERSWAHCGRMNCSRSPRDAC